MKSTDPKESFKKALLTTKKAREDKTFSSVSYAEEGAQALQGSLKIEKVYPDGKRETLVDEKNLVVDQAGTIMAQMSLGLRTMSYIELGDAPVPVPPPSKDDVSLAQTTGVRKAITGNFTGNVATYEATFTTAEANGLTLTEAGLFSTPFGTGLLFARKVFDPIAKNSSFAIDFTWGIAYGVAEGNDGCTGVALLGNSVITQDFFFTSPAGGETEVLVPIDFVIGSKQLDVFLNGVRLVYGVSYLEATVGIGKGVQFQGFSLIQDDEIYVVKRSLS